MYKKQTKTLKQKTLISSGTQDRKNMTSLEDKIFWFTTVTSQSNSASLSAAETFKKKKESLAEEDQRKNDI